MSPTLPASVVAAIEALSEGRSGRLLAQKAQAISVSYRSGAPSSQAIRDEDDALAYALTRMPATFAAVGAALEALKARTVDWTPRSVTDVGCGTGAASLAVVEAFEGLTDVALIDSNPLMLDLATTLLLDASAPIDARLSPLDGGGLPEADLVVAAYVLAEIPEPKALDAVHRLWTAARGALLIVEPGTPGAWTRLMAIRSSLINMDAVVAAPCSHAASCPVQRPDWCHFSQRLPRLRAHRQAKGAEAPYEDEKFAYLAVVRPELALAPPPARILAPPVHDKAALSLKLCDPSGSLSVRRISRRDKVEFKRMRHAAWGEAIDG